MPSIIDKLWSLGDEVTDNKVDLKEAKVRWDQLMGEQLRDWSYNKHAVKDIIEWGENGHNWKLLHWDENTSWEQYFKEFGREIKYCCDRMSLDRLFRCHWLLNAAINRHKYSVQN